MSIGDSRDEIASTPAESRNDRRDVMKERSTPGQIRTADLLIGNHNLTTIWNPY